MNGEQGREPYDDNRSHDLPRIYEVSGIDTDEESSAASSFIEVDSNSNIIACILILLLVESSCDQSRCIKYLHCGSNFQQIAGAEKCSCHSKSTRQVFRHNLILGCLDTDGIGGA
jgi:hypothetical protein